MLGLWWEKAFLEERPSATLGLFRIAVAATLGLHVFPTFLYMSDNYLAAAFREYNASFFPLWVLRWVDGHPDWAVWAAAGAFTAFWTSYLLGFYTQASAALLQLFTYYFYARNSLHIGTLSFDILLVTMFLMLVTPYPGDAFSLDAVLKRADARHWARSRPVFLLRLLQMQVAFAFFYTGLWKWAAGGNWLTDNPYHYLMLGPATGVIKAFPGRAFLAAHPGLCWGLGLACIVFEMTLPLWLFWRRTRLWGVAAGCAFQFWLLVTMHVPTIFFFLFPPQLLLFIDPELLVGWIERRRERWAVRGRDRLVYDGACGFCRGAVARVLAADVAGRLEPVDFTRRDPAGIHPSLTPEACRARLHLVEREGRVTGGFAAFRRMSLTLPLLWPLAPALWLPGSGWIAEPVYGWVSRNRYSLRHKTACRAEDGRPDGGEATS